MSKFDASEAPGKEIRGGAGRGEFLIAQHGGEERFVGGNAERDGVVESANFQGGSVLYRIETAGGRRVLAQQPNNGSHELFQAGAAVALRWKPSDIVILRD